jgi:DNA repair protein RadB
LILPSGISSLDRLLGRGISTGVFTHVFGKAASGKTTFALGFVRSALDLGVRIVYINSEGSSPVERLEQMIGRTYKETEHQLTLLMPKSFDEQGAIVEDLELYIKDDTRLVVIDTLTRLYRTVLDNKQASYAAHRELNRQAGLLKGLARKHDIAVVILNQVRAKMDEPGAIEPVAASIMDYWSDYVIRMTARRETGTRLVERLAPEGDPSSTVLYLTDEGLSGNQAREKQ